MAPPVHVMPEARRAPHTAPLAPSARTRRAASCTMSSQPTTSSDRSPGGRLHPPRHRLTVAYSTIVLQPRVEVWRCRGGGVEAGGGKGKGGATIELHLESTHRQDHRPWQWRGTAEVAHLFCTDGVIDPPYPACERYTLRKTVRSRWDTEHLPKAARPPSSRPLHQPT